MSNSADNGTTQTNDMKSSTSSATSILNNQYHRLCHIVKRPDFDGYGFNLHSEKGKPGQYIGKVDEKSPAEQAGLRQGDRIIEVNGVNISNDAHKQVVQRIKAISNEVRLLVIDPEYDAQLKQSNNKQNKKLNETNQNTVMNQNELNSMENNNKIVSISPTTSTKSQTNSINSSSNKTDVSTTPTLASSVTIAATNGHTINNNNNNNNNSESSPDGAGKKSLSSSTSSLTGNNNNDCSNNNNMMSTPTATAAASSTTTTTTTTTTTESTMVTMSSNSSIRTTSDSQSNGNSSSHDDKSPTEKGKGLNLQMTAAEMRAKLMARKKYDPKNDSVDLRKKFEIIQEL